MQFSALAAGSVSLAWTASTNPIVAGYNVYYGGKSGAYNSKISAGNATNVTISGLTQGATNYFAATTYTSSGVESPLSSEVSYLIPLNVPIVNQPPTLNAIGSLTLNENAGLQTVSLSGITSGATNENQTLTISAVSSNPGLIPNPTINYTSANTTGTLAFTPAANAAGTATITITVNDGGASNNIVARTFTVTVNAVNQFPTLNALGNIVINENAGLQTMNLSGITSGAANEIQTLVVTAVSSNPGLIPNPTVNYTSANSTGTLNFTPAANAAGTATITVAVNDGGPSNNLVTKTFTVTVNAVNQPPTLNAITNLSIGKNAGMQTVNLSGITSGAANEVQTLKVTAISSNLALIPNPTVNYASPNTTGTLTFTPATNATGTATIVVTVNDGGASNNIVTCAFTVNVNITGNQPPTLNPISNLTINQNAGLQTVNLSGITSGAANENQTLKVTATCSNPALISNPTVRYTSPGTNGTLTFVPVVNVTGTVTVTVTVNDGGASNNLVAQTFTVTVLPTGASRPLLASQLTNTVVVTGKTTTFSVAATGTAPLTYQWKFNGANLALATNAALTLSNITTNQAGTYSVAVSNIAGSTNSAATLLVYPTAMSTLASAAHASGQFALTVAGVSGYQYVVQASTDMVNWVPLQTNTAPFTFTDTHASQFSRRYYRSVSLP